MVGGDLFFPCSIDCQDEAQFLCCPFSWLGLFLAETPAEAVAVSAAALLKQTAVAGSYASAHVSGMCAAIGKSPRA